MVLVDFLSLLQLERVFPVNKLVKEINDLADLMYKLRTQGKLEEVESVKAAISEKFIGEIERLARKYARSFSNEYEDLVSEGFMGLLNSMDRYDPQKGNFYNYAKSYIEGYMKKYLERGIQLIGVPATLSKEDRNIKKKLDTLRKKLGREPTLKEIKSVGIDVEDIIKLMWIAMASSPASADAPVPGEDEDMSLHDILSDYDEDKERMEMEVKWLEDNKLTKTERQIWRMYKDGYSQSEISRVLGISQPQVSLVIRRVVEKLKKLLEVRDDGRI